jgi:hypothetical protein
MSCAVVALYIIRIGLFLAFFSFFLAFQRKKNRRLCPWQSLVDANVLVHFFSLSPCSPRLSHILICYCRFFFIFSPFVVIEESVKKCKKKKRRKKNDMWFQFFSLHAMLKQVHPCSSRQSTIRRFLLIG